MLLFNSVSLSLLCLNEKYQRSTNRILNRMDQDCAIGERWPILVLALHGNIYFNNDSVKYLK